ncbi:MAG TPA: hypothetical protein VHC69_33850 [Polyangiaceae bacterium]|nr:hypothetical protein [Polyangiaceae bacterium]
MTIPQTKDFEAIIQSLSLDPPVDGEGYSSVVAVKMNTITEATPTLQEFHKGASGVGVTLGPVSLWHRTNLGLTFDGLVRKVGAELKARGHPSSLEVVLGLLAAFAALKSQTASPVKQLNHLFDCVADTSVSQFAVLPGDPPEEFHLTLPSYELGKLNWTSLAALCERVGTDFHRRYGPRLEHRFGLERKKYTGRAVDWPNFGNRHLSTAAQRSMAPGSLGYYLIDQYYFELARLLTDDFWEGLLEEQHLLLAAGGPYVDERALKSLPTLQFVTIFFWASSGPEPHGWVSPAVHAQMYIELGRADRRLQEVERRLQSDFGVIDSSPGNLHPSVLAYARFVSRAVRHRHDGRPDEAFVHFVIALDLLLGSSEASSKSVSERAAVVTFQVLDVEFGEALRRVRILYDARSKYVHEGRPVDAPLLDQASQICREVLFALLRFVRLSAHRSDAHLVNTWHRELDLCVANLNAKREVAPKDWIAAGVSVAVPDTTQGNLSPPGDVTS